MPPQAYALVSLFLVCSAVVGSIAAWIVGRLGGPRNRRAAVLPIAGAFAAFYLIGHRLGISVGPEVELFGFQVALLGDLSIGFGTALLVAAGQALVVRALPRRGAGQPS
jgi:MFS family permease